MITFETLQLVNEMITQLVACWTILFFKESFKLYLILIIILNTIDLSKQQALGAD